MNESLRVEPSQQEDGNTASLLLRIDELSKQLSSLEMESGWLNNPVELLKRYQVLGQLTSAQRQVIKILMGDTKN